MSACGLHEQGQVLFHFQSKPAVEMERVAAIGIQMAVAPREHIELNRIVVSLVHDQVVGIHRPNCSADFAVQADEFALPCCFIWPLPSTT